MPDRGKANLQEVVAKLLELPPPRWEQARLELGLSNEDWQEVLRRLRSAQNPGPTADAGKPSASTIPREKGETDLAAVNSDLATHEGKESRYRVVERLGKGGWGTVYKAEQRRPVRRIVAIKTITAGVDTPEVVARFESERQALARMDHPHIATVFDAGSTRSRRPYFVMEYVPGEPITQFADRNKLTIAARLELFQQVCEAINHAHTKAVIHRDIKAGNVLAYMHDGRPTAKVIDFGIAKALTGDRLTDRTFNTFRGQIMGTYESMSPEQAGGSPDVDTRSDVNSLGVLLYELLCGTKPFDARLFASAADTEIRRIICEVEPERPSTRLASLGDTAAKIAAARQASIDALAQQFRRELEWIPLMAMRKERDRRYANPLQLAQDIRNYVEGMPLIAGPESRAYRLRKLLWRYKVVAAALSGMAAAIVVGMTLMIVGLRAARASAAREASARQTAVQNAQEAGRQRDQAARQEQIANQVNDFLSTMLASADPGKLMGDKVTVLQATAAAAKQLDAGTLKNQPLVEAAIHTTIGKTLRSLARFDEAEPHLRKALELRRAALPAGHPDLVKSLYTLANLLEDAGKYNEAESLDRQALDTGGKNVLVLSGLANVLALEGRFAEAESLDRQALTILRATSSADNTEVVAVMNSLALSLSDQERYSQAEDLFRQILDIRRRVLPAGHPAIAASLQNLSMALSQQGNYAEAESRLRDALGIYRQTLPPGHPNIARCLNGLADLLTRQGKYADAESLNRQALEMRRKALPPGHADIAQSLNNLGTALFRQNRFSEAETPYREALELRRKALPAGHLDIAYSLINVASALNAQGKLVESEPLYQEALKTLVDHFGTKAPGPVRIAAILADVLEKIGRRDEAATLRDQFRRPPPSTRAASGPVLRGDARINSAK